MFPFRSPALAVLPAILLSLSCLPSLAQAQDSLSDLGERGRAIAASVCAPCHGVDGSAGKRAYPPLAGQSVSYLTTQLEHFRSGARADLEMGEIAAQLNAEDLRAVAYYMSAQPPRTAAAAVAASPIGQQLFAAGRPADGLPACQACHGTRGEGLAAAGLPRLAGQPALYVLEQLQSFRARERGGEAGNPMAEVASRLSDADMRELARFVQAMR